MTKTGTNNTIEVVADVNPYDIIEMSKMVIFYQDMAERARKEVGFGETGKNKSTVIWTGQKGADYASVDPGATWMAMAKQTEIAIMALHRRKMEATLSQVPDANTVIITTAEGKAVVTPKEQMQPIPDKVEKPKENKTEKPEEPANKPVETPAPKVEETEAQKVSRLKQEALEGFRKVHLDNETEKKIADLVNSRKEGEYAVNKDGSYKEVTPNDHNDPNKVVSTRVVDCKPYEVKYEVQRNEDGTVKLVNDKPLKGKEIPGDITKDDRKNKEIIIEKKDKKEILICRSKHSIEKAIDLLRQHLVGQGVKSVEMIDYQELKIRAKAIANKVEKKQINSNKKEAIDLLDKLDIKVGFDSSKVFTGDGLAKMEGQFRTGDEFNLVVLNGGDELGSEDEVRFEAIRRCAAGLREQAIGMLATYYKDAGITTAAAEILLNKLMNPKANPYEKLEKTIENHLLNWQEVLANDVPDGYVKGIPLAKTLLREFSSVFKMKNGNRVLDENNNPIIIRWDDDKIDSKLNTILERLERNDQIPVRMTEKELEELEKQKIEAKAEEEADEKIEINKDGKEKETPVQEPKKEKGQEKKIPSEPEKKKEKKESKGTSTPNKVEEPSKEKKSTTEKSNNVEKPESEPKGGASAPVEKDTKGGSSPIEPVVNEKTEEKPETVKEYVVTIPVIEDGNKRSLVLPGTEVNGKHICEGTTTKSGAQFDKYCVNKVKSYMGQVLKDEKRLAKNSKATPKFPRPTDLIGWKQGDPIKVTIEITKTEEKK